MNSDQAPDTAVVTCTSGGYKDMGGGGGRNPQF